MTELVIGCAIAIMAVVGFQFNPPAELKTNPLQTPSRQTQVHRNVTVSIMTPHPGYRLKTLEQRRVKGATGILMELVAPNPNGVYAAVITAVNKTVRIPENDAVKVYITGKIWDWGIDSRYNYLADQTDYYALFPGNNPTPNTK